MSWFDRSFAPVANVTTTAPHLRSRWSIERINMAVVLAMLPPLAAVLLASPTAVTQRLLLALAVVTAWQVIFATMRGRPIRGDGVATAIAFTVMVPSGAGLWQLALGLSFGVVIAEQVFGGRGWNFLHPVVVALAVLMLSFPNGGYGLAPASMAFAVAPGAVLLLLTGLISWRVVAAAVAALAFIGWFVGLDDPLAQLAVGQFAFALVFLAADPVTSASTNPGRWVYGTMVGGLVALGRASGAGDGVVMAVLLASVFAPSIDQVVIAANVAWRRRRHG